jgi:integrase
LADDFVEADGEHVLSFGQAQSIAQAPEHPRSSPLTVRHAVELYLQSLRNEGRPTGDAETRAKAHILPALGDLKVADLTRDQIRQWLADLANAPAFVRTKKGQPRRFKPTPDEDETRRKRRSSANRVLTILKAALNHAYDEGKVPNNEAWGRRVKPFRSVDAARVRFLTTPEARRLINASDPDFRQLVEGALQTGARYGELVRLKVDDFNPDAVTVHIRRSKSGKARHVVLTDEGAAFFASVTAGRPGSATMFARADGGEWRASHQGRRMTEANKRAKIAPPITFHGLRHTYASLCVMNGVPLLVVSTNLGHANTRMVEKHYGHLAPSYVSSAIRAGAPRFGLGPPGAVVLISGG